MTVNLRIWGIASGAAAVALLAGGWFLGVQPQFAAAAASTTSASAAEAQNQATMIKLAQLSKAAAKLDTMQAQNAVLLKSVPTVLKPNTFIRRVSEVAALDGVDVVSVTPSDAVPYTAPASAAGTAVAGTAAAGQAPAVAAPVLAKTNPLITGANLAVIPMAVVVSGSPADVLQFTHDIQNDQRVFSISGVQTSKNDSSTDVSSSLSGYIYTLKR